MVDKGMLSFLKDLAKNNNKEWFDANRKRYEGERKKLLAFVADLIKGIAEFDASIAGIDPKSTLFRINRDIRFSADKSPYKNNFGVSISKGGKKSPYCGYYLHIQPEKSFVGGGVYAPSPEKLKSVRDEIYFTYPEFDKILSAKNFRKYFSGIDDIEKLKTSPKGYEKEHPSLPYLVHKHFIASVSLSDEEVISERFLGKVLDIYKAQKPLVDFLNRAIDTQPDE